jgi:hypothetical protein
MRYVFAIMIAFFAAAQLVTSTDVQVAKADQKSVVSIDIAALTRAAGDLPVTVADAI